MCYSVTRDISDIYKWSALTSQLFTMLSNEGAEKHFNVSVRTGLNQFFFFRNIFSRIFPLEFFLKFWPKMYKISNTYFIFENPLANV